MMNEREIIGSQIANIRQQLNMTQQDLADKCGMTRTTISKIESGRFNASIDVLSKLLHPIGYRISVVHE